MLPIVFLILTAGATEPEPALGRLARSVADQAARGVPEPPMAIYVEGPTPALSRAFGSLLAAELATRKLSPVVLEAPSASAAEHAAREKDFRSLVRVTLAAENTRIVARGDVLHTWVNFWAGLAPTRSGKATALASTVDADLQAMTMASSPSSVVPASTPLKLGLGVLTKLSSPPAAIAVGDLDGDKRAEIVVLTDDDLLVFFADGRPLARYDLRGLPVSNRPTREPFGAVSITLGQIAWLSGRRAHGETLKFTGGSFAKNGTVTDEVALDGVSVRLVPGLNAFAAEAGWFGKSVLLPALLTTTNTRVGVALFLFANGTGSITRGLVPTTFFSGAPSAAVIADLDGDGTPELLVTSARFFPDGDELKVLSIAAVEGIAARSGSLAEATAVWSGPTPRGRVLSSAAGDLDGDGADEVVLGSWLKDGTGEVYLAKRLFP